MDDTIFRAYDIRGVYPQDLSEENTRLIGQSIATAVLSVGQNSIAVARDGRNSGPVLRDALCEGLRGGGCHVIDIGRVPTPVLYFATHYFSELNSGVMITGSHNPADYNGFKIVVNGETLSGDAIQAIRQRITNKALSKGEGTYQARDILPAYKTAFMKRDQHQLQRPLKVVVDCGNGVSGIQAPDLIAALGCEVVPLYAEVDGDFPNHHPDPGDPENLRDLIIAVADYEADLGLAFDGDGDRLGIVTSTGHIIYPDILLMALAEDMVSRNPGAKVIFDVKCTGALFEVISKVGGDPEMWQTGHSLIKARMKETGALLAGEMSGHIFFAEDWFGFDDAAVAAARLLSILSHFEGDADQFFDLYPTLLTTPEIPIPAFEDHKFVIIKELQTNADFGAGRKSTIDGVRVDYQDGWGLCRASNTSPKLVTRFEGVSEKALNRIRTLFEEKISQAQNTVKQRQESAVNKA